MTTKPQKKITIKTEILKFISKEDLADLCNITEEAIKAGGGFGWLKVPSREILNKYWNGLVPNRNEKTEDDEKVLNEIIKPFFC